MKVKQNEKKKILFFTCRLTRLYMALAGSGLDSDVYAAVNQLIRISQKESEELEAKHKAAMAKLEADYKKLPQCN